MVEIGIRGGMCHAIHRYDKANNVDLVDVLANFRNMCIKVYELDPSYFLSAPGLA